MNISDHTVLSDFEILTAASGPNRAIMQEFTAEPKDGILKIDFLSKTGAIRIYPKDRDQL